MNTGKIPYMPFKGAYMVSGRGGEVKKAEEKIRAEAGCMANVDILGNGYSAVDMPACFLVTTGNDALAYNKFVLKQQKYYDLTASKMPEERTIDDFKSKREFLAYKIEREMDTWIKTVREKCNFNQVPDVLDAELVLEAIDSGCFDYTDGKFVVQETKK